jgi:hypothetical protein
MIQSRSWHKLILGFFVFLLVTATAAYSQRGALTTPRALDELAQEADLIVHGRITSAKVEPHPQFKNLMTVLVSMNVEETLKGSTPKSFQFRQYIWDIRDQLDSARYAKGQDLLLMLGPVSKYGLTSPVGLEQGRFRISRDSTGREVAINGSGNLRLFDSTEQRARARGIELSARTLVLSRQNQAGPLALSDLEEAVRTFARTK